MPKEWVEETVIRNGEPVVIRALRVFCGKCRQDGEERYSLGIFAGYYCDKCWDEAGYRKEGKEGYDYLDAGEFYEADEY